MEIKDNRCAFVISSFDGFSDVWEAFFTFFFKYWPDCPYPVYLISDTKIYNNPRVRSIRQGIQGKDWASCVIDSLKKIPEKYILYVQEDYLLTGPVNTKRVGQLLDLLIDSNIGCIRLHPAPPPDNPYGDDLGEITKGSSYSFSLQATLWKKDIFLSLLLPKESMRTMEMNASIRAKDLVEPFLSVFEKERPFPYFSTAIKGGRWYYDAAKLCRDAGIKLDPNRKVESFRRYIFRKSGLARLVGIWRHVSSRRLSQFFFLF